MKVKEANLTAHVAWSPVSVNPTLLCCATATQQIDPTAKCCVQLFDLNLCKQTLDMKEVASVSALSRFHTMKWGCISNQYKSGLVIGGCENGGVYIYDTSAMLSKRESVIASIEGKHCGPVFAVDINPFQWNLFASGSAESEVFVWDLNNPKTPMAPGAKHAIAADVTCVAWNRHVENILASAHSGNCVVWDLKKMASIFQISESMARMKINYINWHPNIATQMVCASSEVSVAQIWDLRYPSKALKTIEGHQDGMTSMVWCDKDDDLLITSAKDNRTLVWNTNTADSFCELVGEFPIYNQWNLSVSWCGKDPSLVATGSTDGVVSVLSLTGAGVPPSQTDKFSAIADSFPGMEMPSVAPSMTKSQTVTLKRPPKWFRSPAAASFAFGGRLLTCNGNVVNICQVVTEQELVTRSHNLQLALAQSNLHEFCHSKADVASHQSEKTLWHFIGATFERENRSVYSSLLGFSELEIASRRRNIFDLNGINENLLSEKLDLMMTQELNISNESLDASEQFEMIANASDKTSEIDTLPRGTSCVTVSQNMTGLTTLDLLVGQLQSAVNLCILDKQFLLALIIASHVGGDLFIKTRDCVLNEIGGGLAGLVGAVVRGDVTPIVKSSMLGEWKETLMAILTYASDEQLTPLAESLGDRLLQEGSLSSVQSAMICFICAGSVEKCVQCFMTIEKDAIHSPDKLQDLVEIVMVLQRGASASGRNVAFGEAVKACLCQYASLLAAQGALETAALFLTADSQGEMLNLRQRIYHSLNLPMNQQQQQSNLRRSSTPQQFPPSRAPMIPSARATPLAEAFPMKSMQPIEIMQQVKGPSSLVPPQFTPSVQAQQRNVFSNDSNSYQTNVPSFFMPNQSPSVTPMMPSMMSPMMPSMMSPMMPSMASPMMPSMASPMIPTAPTVAPPPSAPLTGHVSLAGLRNANKSVRFPSNEPIMNSPPTVSTFAPTQFMPAFTPSMGPSAPPSFLTPTAPPTMNQPDPVTPKTPAAFDPNVLRGWNDPPPLTGSTRKMKTGVHHESAKPFEPILAPVPSTGVGEQQFLGFQPSGGNYFSPAAPPAQEVFAPPIPAVVKREIPAEHSVIHDVIISLHSKCCSVAQNAQMKQRLEKLKFEILFDKLANHQLNSSTISGLHELVAAMSRGDYMKALQIHQQMCVAGNFAELSSFMPDMKVLIQMCMQHQVFYQ